MFNISEEELYKLYIEQNLSAREISKKFDITVDTVKNKLSKYKIKKDKKLVAEKIKEGALTIRKQTCLEKYGTEHPLQNPKVKAKSEATCISKYGCKSPLCSQKVRDKRKETMIKKYGVDTPMKSLKLKTKIQQTNLNKYGHKNPLLNNKIKKKKEKNYDK